MDRCAEQSEGSNRATKANISTQKCFPVGSVSLRTALTNLTGANKLTDTIIIFSNFKIIVFWLFSETDHFGHKYYYYITSIEFSLQNILSPIFSEVKVRKHIFSLQNKGLL